jgi:MbtH protein
MTEDPQYQVVVNGEDQHSLWLAHRDVPDGWSAEGYVGSRQQCLDHIETVWTDMRPRGDRLRAEAGGAQ